MKIMFPIIFRFNSMILTYFLLVFRLLYLFLKTKYKTYFNFVKL
jgi:hypothetical protein